MLNRNQRNFKKEMKKIGKEERKKNPKDVYSYVQDKHVASYYSGSATAPINPFFSIAKVIMNILLWVIAIVGVLLLVFGGAAYFALCITFLMYSIVFLVFGVVHPSLALRWGFPESQSRGKVLITYGTAFFVFIILSVISVPSANSATTGPSKNNSLIPAAVSANVPIQMQTEGKDSVEQFKKSTRQVTYMDLARNPDNFKSIRVTVKGKVIEVIASGKSLGIRVNLSQGDYGSSQDTVFVNYQLGAGESRILDNDVISVWGTSKGLKTYKSVLGSQVSLPEIDAKYVVINGNDKP